MSFDWLENILSILNKLEGLNAGALVFFSCIGLGYLLKFIKRFPNDSIPLVILLWGPLFMMFIADARSTTMSARVWVGRNLLVGLVIAALAWGAHYYFLYRIERWFKEKFGSDTRTFTKDEKSTTDTDSTASKP